MVRSISLKFGLATISVLVADSTALEGRLIADALRKDRGLTVTSAEVTPVILTATTLKPDVAIISEQLQGKPGKGLEVLRELRLAAPGTRTVMLLDCSERGQVVEAFRSGARGIFCRSDPLKMLTRCVHKVHDGQLWISNARFEFLLETLAQAPATRIVNTRGANLLSKREQDVVRWLVEGNSNYEIARKLDLSENTVKNYLFRIFNKLGVSSRVEVIMYAASQRAAGQSIKLEALAARGDTVS